MSDKTIEEHLRILRIDYNSIPSQNKGGYTFERYAAEMLAAQKLVLVRAEDILLAIGGHAWNETDDRRREAIQRIGEIADGRHSPGQPALEQCPACGKTIHAGLCHPPKAIVSVYDAATKTTTDYLVDVKREDEP